MLRKVKVVQDKMDARRRWEDRKKEGFRQNGAAITIQRFWRRILRRRRHRVLDRIIKNRKATIIQKYYRRHRAQQLRKRLRKDRDDFNKKYVDAAILVRATSTLPIVGIFA